MHVRDFDFELPESAIARYPAERRDASRLLVVDRSRRSLSHHRFSELPDLLAGGDLLVVNDTKVLEGRLRTTKEGTGGRVELLLVEPVHEDDPLSWKAMAVGAKSLRVGQRLILEQGFDPLEIEACPGMGFVQVRLPCPAPELADRFGELPLPPYLKRSAEPPDAKRYQTVFADPESRRSVAAPTAGLHFTPELLQTAKDRGIDHTHLTLHVGPGTFLPVREEQVERHVMHSERYSFPETAAARIAEAKSSRGRVVAVGTTATRVLETKGRDLTPGHGSTDIFIRPGFQFQVVDALITNFHLPRSTLLMLVSAFADRELILQAYEVAVQQGYRFYSYGDAMLIL